MVNGKLRLVNKLFILIIILIPLLGCLEKKRHRNDKFETEYKYLNNGDIIYRLGDGLFSDYFKTTSTIEKLYSHTGIIHIQNDDVFVIHSEASEFTGIGGVKEEKIENFLYNVNTWAAYRADTTYSARDTISNIAMQYLKKKTPFDLAFDNNSDEKLYCSELIANAINRTYKRKIINPTGVLHAKPFYSIDDTYLIPEMKLIIKFIDGNKQNNKPSISYNR